MDSSKNKNVKWIYIAAVGVILVSVTVFFYERVSDQKQDAARNALYEARKLFPNPTDTGAMIDPDQVYAEAVSKLSDLAKSSHSQAVQFEAALELGALFTSNGKSERALVFLLQAERVANSDLKRSAVSWLKAHAYSQQKMWSESEAEYVKVSKSKDVGMKGRALVELIEMAQTNGKQESAKAYFETLKREFVQDTALVAEGEKALEGSGGSL